MTVRVVGMVDGQKIYFSNNIVIEEDGDYTYNIPNNTFYIQGRNPDDSEAPFVLDASENVIIRAVGDQGGYYLVSAPNGGSLEIVMM